MTILTFFKSGCTMVNLVETYVNISDNSTDLDSILDLLTVADGPELYIGLAICCVGLVLYTLASYAIIKTSPAGKISRILQGIPGDGGSLVEGNPGRNLGCK